MIRPFALVDLDDTLFQTLRKCPDHIARADLQPVAFDREGAPLGFATPCQQAFLEWLTATAVVVPVTARSKEALGRVCLPFTVAVCAHGGVVLGAEGRVEPRWAAHVVREAAPYADELEKISQALQASAQADGTALNVRVLSENGCRLYVLAKHPKADDAALHRVARTVGATLPSNWTLHLNSNNAAFLPPFLGKRQAVASLLPELRAREPRAPVIGVGDSLTDAGFMALCDYAMTPPGSQLGAAMLGGCA